MNLFMPSVKKENGRNLTVSYNPGGYRLVKSNRPKEKDSVIFYIKVIDVETKAPLSPANIKVPCSTIPVDDKGECFWKVPVELSEALDISALAIEYYTVDIQPIKLDGSFNVIEFVFALGADERPIYNCDGQLELFASNAYRYTLNESLTTNASKVQPYCYGRSIRGSRI